MSPVQGVSMSASTAVSVDSRDTDTRPAAPTGRAPRRPVARRGRGRMRLELAVLLVPPLALFGLFVIYPIGLAVYDSLYNWNGFGPLTDFVGMQNYSHAMGDPVFRHAIWHNILFALLTLILQLPLSLSLAFMLNRRMRGRAALRLLVFTPYVLSEAVTAVVWLTLLQPGGAVDEGMKSVGLGGLVHQWLADRGIVLYALFVVITWKYIGFGIILFLAGLQGIPAELREAAALDGASNWQAARLVVLPLLAPTIRIWIFLSIIGALQLFDLVWIMTLGGPAGASTTMATYLIDRGFQRYQFGYGSAVAVMLFVVCFVFALLYQRFALRRDTSGALTGMTG
jgi:raffinose/stachyose/melibiose transport system permease protein